MPAGRVVNDSEVAPRLLAYRAMDHSDSRRFIAVRISASSAGRHPRPHRVVAERFLSVMTAETAATRQYSPAYLVLRGESQRHHGLMTRGRPAWS